MGRKNNRAQSPPPAPEPEPSVPEGEPAPEARPPLQVPYCSGAWPNGHKVHSQNLTQKTFTSMHLPI
jgi:hypothetical protein